MYILLYCHWWRQSKLMHSGWYVSIMQLRSLTGPALIVVAVLKGSSHILLLPFRIFFVLRVRLTYTTGEDSEFWQIHIKCNMNCRFYTPGGDLFSLFLWAGWSLKALVACSISIPRFTTVCELNCENIVKLHLVCMIEKCLFHATF